MAAVARQPPPRRLLEGLRLPPVPANHRRRLTMKPLLLAVVLLSWGYVIYASTVAARRQLSKEYPDKIFGMNENL